MKEIQLIGGSITKIDDEDYEWVIKSSWHNKDGYAHSRVTGAGSMSMHRELINAPQGMDVDHIDGDKLNNQKHNLRLATRSQNKVNSKLYKNNTSGYRGVYLKESGRYEAKVGINRRQISLGRF